MWLLKYIGSETTGKAKITPSVQEYTQGKQKEKQKKQKDMHCILEMTLLLK